MDDDLTTLEQVLRDRAAEVPHLQEAPTRMLVRARRRVVRNAVTSAVAAGLIIVGASAGLAGLRASSSGLGGSPTPTPSTSACIAADLQASATLQGAAGSLEGSIDVTNHGDRTCTLEGRPSVTLAGPSGSQLSLEVQPVEAQWQADQTARPTGWPVVVLRPGSAAAIRIRLSNLCQQLDGAPLWTIDLTDGKGSLDVADAESIPTCVGAAEPSRLEVGPFEPGGEG